MFHSSPRPRNNNSSTYEDVSSHLKNKPTSAERNISPLTQLLLTEQYVGDAQLLNPWNQTGRCYPYFLFHDDCHAVFAFYHSNTPNLTKICLRKKCSTSNLETVNSFKLIVHLATNRLQVLLYFPWKCKLPDSTSVSWWQYPRMPWWSLGNMALWQGIT